MNTTLEYYDVFPKIMLVGAETKVTIRPLGTHVLFDPSEGYTVCILPMRETLEPNENGDKVPDSKYPWTDAVREGNLLTFTYRFGREQEYLIRMYKKSDVTRKGATQFRVYAVDADLFERRPYKGDMHAHSTWSDGKESPEIVMASYRKAGFDFTGLTDHRKHAASVAAIDAYKDAAVDMCMCKGEEVHIKGNHVHIVNFGSEYSVQEFADADLNKFKAEVHELADIAKNLQGADFPKGVNRFEYFACLWIFKRIQEAGGLAIFPHPHWRSNVYHDPEDMTDALFASGAFDAFELLGGVGPDDNNTQAALYNEARAKGLDLKVVGSSDSHGQINTDYFNWYTTVLFAKDLSIGGIREAVRSGYSVAVERYPGENARVHGPYRFVSFTLFLLSEYFPVHDEMCFEEGRQMKEYAVGSMEEAAGPGAPQNATRPEGAAQNATRLEGAAPDVASPADVLKMLSGRTKRYLDKIYGKID